MGDGPKEIFAGMSKGGFVEGRPPFDISQLPNANPGDFKLDNPNQVPNIYTVPGPAEINDMLGRENPHAGQVILGADDLARLQAELGKVTIANGGLGTNVPKDNLGLGKDTLSKDSIKMGSDLSGKKEGGLNLGEDTLVKGGSVGKLTTDGLGVNDPNEGKLGLVQRRPKSGHNFGM